jgi:hypothetical protein
MNKISRREILRLAALGAATIGVPQRAFSVDVHDAGKTIHNFEFPPDDARPWVYWYFMDGNLRREGMDADLAAMKRAGIGGAIYLEVGIGIEPGPVEFMSDPWQQLLGHAFEEADRLGLQISLGAGPGWCGTGGPWMTPDRSMQHLVASTTQVRGPVSFNTVLPQPPPRTPFFGTESLSPELLTIWQQFYRDEFVLAFPTPVAMAMITDIDEKALYTRGSYSSQIVGPFATRPWVRPFFQSELGFASVTAEHCVASRSVVNLSAKLSPDGHLAWEVPPGDWTIMRFGRTLTGQTTRPSPKPGLGLESDKFDAAAMDAHFDAYILPLLKRTRAPQHRGRGLVALHFDSWEMSSQNWSPDFRQEFEHRRGYDPLAMLPSFAGLVVDSPEVSERFLWDIRQTASELICQNQAERLRERGKQFGLSLELEPYDLNPAADLDLGATADLPMAEFWTKSSISPPTDFSLAEAASVGHTHGRRIIGAEAFTATMDELWHQHPGSMKAQGDWAFCQGINKFVIHRFQAQPWLDRFPGMTMGPDGGYGVHWDHTQTWWDFVPAYHLYLSRCQSMLRRGLFVADILYLTPEGAPNVFFPPRSAFRPGTFSDRRGYNFDGCAAETLITRAVAKDGRIVFPDGMSYRVLVLPRFQSMTLRLLTKIVALVEDGITVLGAPPQKSPSLSNYPDCDRKVRDLATRLWPQGATQSERQVGVGRVIDDITSPADHSNPLAQAQWVWSAPETGLSSVAGNNPTFSRDFSVEDPRSIETGVLTITADESYELSLNGNLIASGNAEQRARRLDISSLLDTGSNRLTVSVKASTNTSRQSGLLASLAITYRDGHRDVINTDRQWSWSVSPTGLKAPASELGPYNRPPWNITDSSIEQEDIYPSYFRTAELLQRMSVEPDFESDALLRFLHRRDGDEDIYFVANGEDRPQRARCQFRVTGRQPEWWNPITGERRNLPEFSDVRGRTEVPLHFDRLESGFVVFRKNVAARGNGVNSPDYQTLLTLAGPWEVGFDPKWGGPQQIVFQTLDDWSKRPEPGVRHYSGKATYKTSFDCSEPGGHLHHVISLGRVANIASVKINDRDIGVTWCEPWRVAIPVGLLRRHANLLEVTVANLWINRLIGDSNLPEDQRFTKITGNPFHPDDTLLESGLVGPVMLQAF